MSADFAAKLVVGKTTERFIARWLRARGFIVLPTYETPIDSGRAPRLFGPDDTYIAPDQCVFGPTGVALVEAKHKSVFSWHRVSKQWVTGIDRFHFDQYQEVSRLTRVPTLLLFFHYRDEPDARDVAHGCPATCPTGLFGGNITTLAGTINHSTPSLDVARDGVMGHGRSGMVYWALPKLRRLASCDAVMRAAANDANEY